MYTGKCKTAYGHSHRRPSVGGLEIDIIENGGASTPYRAVGNRHRLCLYLTLPNDNYVYFQSP